MSSSLYVYTRVKLCVHVPWSIQLTKLTIHSEDYIIVLGDVQVLYLLMNNNKQVSGTNKWNAMNRQELRAQENRSNPVMPHNGAAICTVAPYIN